MTTEGVDPREADVAAAAALARARASAAEKGLRPGSAPRRKRRRAIEQAYSTSTKDGRDPALIGEQIDRLLLDRGWNVDVSAGAVMGRWSVIVGADVAAHSAPITFTDGELLVRADSTAWATQLRHMVSTLLARLEAEAGPGVVTSLRIVGPSSPSWRRGPRRAAGPGPRDTYG
ncbi:MAG: DciA family protein [Micrococcales bacterium]|nr:DciA family protein [Micrococcales bacterium]